MNFLRDFIGERGYPPTLREIASQFGLKGPRAPQRTLNILERKGYIRRTPGGSRAIEILVAETGSPYGMIIPEESYRVSYFSDPHHRPCNGRRAYLGH